MQIKINKKEALNLKEIKEVYITRSEEKKGKGEMLQLYYNLKKKIK